LKRDINVKNADLNGTVPRKNMKNVQIVNLRIYTPLMSMKRSRDQLDSRGLGEEVGVGVLEQALPGCANVISVDMKPPKLREYHAETINVQNVALHYVGLIKIKNRAIEVKIIRKEN
jgi:hypothetical protein